MNDRPFDTGPPDAQSIASQSDVEAVAIYQRMIDLISRLFWSRDWASLADLIVVPNKLRSIDSARQINDMEEWISVAKSARRTFDEIGATEYHRICHGACFQTCEKSSQKTGILGVHETYILRGSTLAQPPHHGFMTLAKVGGVWKSAGLYTEKREKVFPTIFADRISPGGT